MTDHISLTCPSCGGKLQISNDIDRFACSYCGNEQIVRRSGGIVSLKPVIEALDGVKVGVDRTASELAIMRLEREILELERQRRGMLAKPLIGGSFILWSGTFILLGLVTILFGFMFLFFQKDLTGLCLGSFLFGIGVVIVLLKYLIIRQEKLDNKQRLVLNEQMLREKRASLYNHQNIVSQD